MKLEGHLNIEEIRKIIIQLLEEIEREIDTNNNPNIQSQIKVERLRGEKIGVNEVWQRIVYKIKR